MPDFDVNPSRHVQVLRIGRDRLPVIIIDSFMRDPAPLIARAAEAVFIDAGSVYPGVRAPAPKAYVDALLAATSRVIEEAFGAPPADELELCAFSMVTTLPADLRPIQRIPHFDGPDEDRIAFLHYLCLPRQGGTSFYRHRPSDFERVTRNRVEGYRATVVAGLETESSARGYVADGTRFFERIHTVDAEFNRLVIYKGNALHSADISSRTILSENLRLGRLTINGFGRLTAN